MDGDRHGYGYTFSGGYTAYNGVPPRTDEWSKTSYTSDHVRQPVFTDADGSRKPILSYTPNGNTECYVTKTEIVEVPFVTGYKQSTPVKVEVVLMDNGDVESTRNRPSSPVHELPQQVEEFITKIQTEASRPSKFGPPSATYWNHTPNPNSNHGNNGYGDQSDLINKEWQKPSGNTIRSENYDGPYKRENYLEPTMTTSGAWAKPSHGAWSTGQEANLSKPKSDISTAMENLKVAVKPSSGITPPSRYTIPASTGPKKDTYTETIDNREAERRCGNLNLASRPMDNYTRTIDSREAARKYGGTIPASTGPKRDTHPGTIDSREAERRYGNLNLAPRPIDNYTRTIDSREAARKYGGTIPASTGPMRDTHPETIDSREAERRYGNLNLAPRPIDNYTRTIDSREAARKYGGTIPASTGPMRDTHPETIDSREAERRYGNLNLAPRPIDNYTRTIDSREAARKYGGTTV